MKKILTILCCTLFVVAVNAQTAVESNTNALENVQQTEQSTEVNASVDAVPTDNLQMEKKACSKMEKKMCSKKMSAEGKACCDKATASACCAKDGAKVAGKSCSGSAAYKKACSGKTKVASSSTEQVNPL